MFVGYGKTVSQNTVLSQYIVTASFSFSGNSSHLVFSFMLCWSLFQYSLGSVKKKNKFWGNRSQVQGDHVLSSFI